MSKLLILGESKWVLEPKTNTLKVYTLKYV